MSLKHSYTLLAPVYDSLIEKATAHWRRHSYEKLNTLNTPDVLINGIGSGLDIPHLPGNAIYTGTDLTPAMLKRAANRAQQTNTKIELIEANSLELPFEDNQFDVVIMHLILAVVPDPARAFSEAIRILKPGGRIHIFDKFLKPGQLAPMRRLSSLFLRHIATRTDVVFEELFEQHVNLKLIERDKALAAGWFQFIILQKENE